MFKNAIGKAGLISAKNSGRKQPKFFVWKFTYKTDDYLNIKRLV